MRMRTLALAAVAATGVLTFSMCARAQAPGSAEDWKATAAHMYSFGYCLALDERGEFGLAPSHPGFPPGPGNPAYEGLSDYDKSAAYRQHADAVLAHADKMEACYNKADIKGREFVDAIEKGHTP
jgi:hypothetical protein